MAFVADLRITKYDFIWGTVEPAAEAWSMPRKVRDLIEDLMQSGFYEISGGGKGPHRKFTHANFRGAVTVSGVRGMMQNHIKRSKSNAL